MFYIVSAILLFIAVGVGIYTTIRMDKGLDDE